MIGSIRWNLTAGLIGFAGTLLAAWQHNIISTALLRSLYSGTALFFIAFLFRWAFGVLIHRGISGPSDSAPENEQQYKGTQIDLATPESGDSPGQGATEQEAEEQTFAPLRPTRLATKSDIEPQELANALRRMSEE